MSHTAYHPGASRIASRNPEVHSGDLVFAEMRVPIGTFVECLKDGGTVDKFLAGYSTVARWQALGLLEILAPDEAAQDFQVRSATAATARGRSR